MAVSPNHTTTSPARACPRCGDPHDEILRLLAGEPDGYLRRVPSAPASTCPSCGWRFTPRRCCGDPHHDFATLCPKCNRVFISAVTP